MQATFELDIIESTVTPTWTDDDGITYTGDPYLTRKPDLAGATIARMAQLEDRGDTMLVWIEADDAQVNLLPANRRRS